MHSFVHWQIRSQLPSSSARRGVTEAVERELDALLESHELVKGKVLESAMLTPRTVSEEIGRAHV